MRSSCPRNISQVTDSQGDSGDIAAMLFSEREGGFNGVFVPGVDDNGRVPPRHYPILDHHGGGRVGDLFDANDDFQGVLLME